MNPLLLLNWRLWAAVAVAVALVASHWKVYNIGKANVQAQWTAERLELAKQSMRLVEKTIVDTAELQSIADKLTEAKNEQIQSLNARVSDLNERVRNRPQRPGSGVLPSATSDGKVGPGATGEGLYREDGQFLVGEASDTAKLQIGLKACYAQYDAARAKLEAIADQK